MMKYFTGFPLKGQQRLQGALRARIACRNTVGTTVRHFGSTAETAVRHFGSTDGTSVRHYGMTLVELLVVMGVLSVLTAIALPNIRTMIKQQRLSRGAAAVQAYIDGARAKAISDGQPYGVIIERVGIGNPVDRSQSILLRYAYSPPAYSGDVPEAVAVVLPSGNLAFSPMHAPTLVAAARQRTAGSREPVVRSGDMITIGTVGVTLPIIDIRYATSADFAFTAAFSNLNQSPGFVPGNWPAGMPTDAQVADWPVVVLDNGAAYSPADRIVRVLNPGTITPFTITRRPRASILPPLEMVEGTVIDLNYSGVGIGNANFSPAIIEGNVSDTSPAFFNAGRNYGSVTIMFDPSGAVSEVRTGIPDSSDPTRSIEVVSAITSNVFLLVGRAGNVRPGDNVDGITGVNGPVGQDKSGIANLLDLEAVWIAINRQSGEIYTATVDALPRATDGSLVLPGATPLAKLNNAIITSQTSIASYYIGGSE